MEKLYCNIQWKNYEIGSPEYVETLEETRKIVDELRQEWNKTLIHPFVFFNDHGKMFHCIAKNIEDATYGQWINHIISLTLSQKDNKVVGFDFSDPDYVLEEAIKNETVDKTLSNSYHVKRTSSYENGWITCVYDDKKIENLTKKRVHPLLHLYFENNFKPENTKAFSINYKELVYIEEYQKEKSREFDEILKEQDLQEVDHEWIHHTMKQGGWKIVEEDD